MNIERRLLAEKIYVYYILYFYMFNKHFYVPISILFYLFKLNYHNIYIYIYIYICHVVYAKLKQKTGISRCFKFYDYFSIYQSINQSINLAIYQSTNLAI